MPQLAPYHRYARDVVAGRVPASRWVVLACERHLRDLRDGRERGLRFDAAAAQHALDFFSLLRHSKGQWAGQVFRLEPWQSFCVASLFGWQRKVDGEWVRRYRKAYVQLSRKNGKALAIDTPIPTPGGWTLMGDLQPGDSVFDECGNPCMVEAVTPVYEERPAYELQFSDGTFVTADVLHEWWTKTRSPQYSFAIRETEQVARTLTYGGRGDLNHSIPVAAALRLPTVELPIHPYVLGAWLGDGTSDNANLTCGYQDLAILDHIVACGVSVQERSSSNAGSGRFLLGSGGRSQRARDQSLQSILRKEGLLGNKHIPAVYLRASYEQRLSLLQGLMDTDGYVSQAGQCEFATSNPVLRDGVIELLRTLGMKPTAFSHKPHSHERGRDSFRILFKAFDSPQIFRLGRKLRRLSPAPGKSTRSQTRQIVDMREVRVPTRCIQVTSPSRLFLAGEAMVPTHNSTIAAGIALYLFYGDGEPGADVYAAATKNAQAKIVWGEAMRMVRASPRLARAIDILGGERPGQMANMNIVETASKFEPLGADRDTTDGLNVHGAVIDELHAHKGRGMWDILETATGARRQPMLLAITTAGYDRHSICWEVRDYSAKVLEGVLDDDTWFAFVAEVAEDADWTDEACWPHGNPNLGVSVKLDDLRALAAKAAATPAAQNAFRRLRLDQWTDQASRWMPTAAWDACRGEVDMEALRGRECYAGLDLSSTKDLTALVLYFPPNYDDVLGRILAYFWVPEENVEKRSRDDRVPYKAWIAAGHIAATPGNVVDYDRIREFVKSVAVRYHVAEIAYDPWRATQLAVQLQEDGATCVEFRQGMASMAGPMAEAEKLILGKKIRHDGNPVLRWNVSNVAVKQDEAGNSKPDKARSRERVDGLVAMVMAVGRAMVHALRAPSRFEREGEEVIML